MVSSTLEYSIWWVRNWRAVREGWLVDSAAEWIKEQQANQSSQANPIKPYKLEANLSLVALPIFLITASLLGYSPIQQVNLMYKKKK